MTEPSPPPDRLQSDRERLLQTLSGEPQTARELSQRAGLSERAVFEHLQHLQKSLRTHGRRLEVSPATCLDCQFIFRKRDRLTRPGKCPVCRSSHLSDPAFSIS